MMFTNFSEYQVFIKPGRTDMRKAIVSLNEIIAYEMNLDIYSKSLFLFCSKNKKTIKIVYWDKNGFCIWQKKLEKEKFFWPKMKSEIDKISIQQLQWLLLGIDFNSGHKEINLSKIK
jgi:transposase